MRVALVTYHADPARGGAERYAWDLAAALAARGHAVTLLSVTKDAQPTPTGFERVALSSDAKTRRGRYAAFLNAVDARFGNFDVVHALLPVRRCHAYHLQAGIESASFRALPWWKRAGNPRRRLIAATECALLGGPTPPVALCLSKAQARALTALFPDVPTRLLYQATNRPTLADDELVALRDSTRHEMGLSPESPVAVFVGGDFARKGLATAVAAVARVPGATLLVAGGGDAEPYRAPHVRFLGNVADPTALYAAADALLLPSRHEPFGMVAVEALACACVPVVSAACGAAEVVRDGANGYVVERAADAAGFAAAFLRAIAYRASMRGDLRATAETLSHSAHVTAVEEAYGSGILPSRGASA